MYHPLDRLTRRQLTWAFAVTSCLMVMVSVILAVSGRRLQTDVARHGILALELAGDSERAQTIIRSWQEADIVPLAAFNVGLDYLFLIIYSSCLSLGCVWAARRLSSRTLVVTATALAWMQWGAGLLDAVENVALLQMIGGSSDAVWPRLARACALPKFGLTAAGILFIATMYAFSRWAEALPYRFGRAV